MHRKEAPPSCLMPMTFKPPKFHFKEWVIPLTIAGKYNMYIMRINKSL